MVDRCDRSDRARRAGRVVRVVRGGGAARPTPGETSWPTPGGTPWIESRRMTEAAVFRRLRDASHRMGQAAKCRMNAMCRMNQVGPRSQELGQGTRSQELYGQVRTSGGARRCRSCWCSGPTRGHGRRCAASSSRGSGRITPSCGNPWRRPRCTSSSIGTWPWTLTIPSPIPTGTSVNSSTMCSPVAGSTDRHGWGTTSRARCAGSASTSFQRSVCDIEQLSNWRWPRPGAPSLGCCADPLTSVRIGATMGG